MTHHWAGGFFHRSRVVVLALLMLAASAMYSADARAQQPGAVNVEFAVNGTLPVFPCPLGCDATFSGSGSAAGGAHGQNGAVRYTAAFAMLSAPVSGSAAYTEPGQPFCPAVGSAAGTVTVDGAASGVIHRTSSPTLTGTVTGVSLQLTYTYQRVGPLAVITITEGTATVSFSFPGTGPGSFTSSVIGAGTGAFDVDALQAVDACAAPSALPFAITGDAALALT